MELQRRRVVFATTEVLVFYRMYAHLVVVVMLVVNVKCLLAMAFHRILHLCVLVMVNALPSTHVTAIPIGVDRYASIQSALVYYHQTLLFVVLTVLALVLIIVYVLLDGLEQLVRLQLAMVFQHC
jgi:hypothetical protein